VASFWRNRKVPAIAVAAVILGGAVAISYALAPEPVESSTLGEGWQCHQVVGFFTTCSQESRVDPMAPRYVPVDFRRVREGSCYPSAPLLDLGEVSRQATNIRAAEVR
jgi:hypothetical protein